MTIFLDARGRGLCLERARKHYMILQEILQNTTTQGYDIEMRSDGSMQMLVSKTWPLNKILSTGGMRKCDQQRYSLETNPSMYT